MKFKAQAASAALLAVFTISALAPVSVFADSRQSNKNTWRNVGVGGAAVAGYGLLHHNTTATVLGAGAAAYGAHRYEQDRHSQDQAKRARLRYHRTHRTARHR